MKKFCLFFCFWIFNAVLLQAQIETLSSDQDHLPDAFHQRAEPISAQRDSSTPSFPTNIPIRIAPPTTQDTPNFQPQTPPSTEKILLFDTHVTIRPDTQITVTENITVNVLHQQIRRGIYRDIPVSFSEKATPQTLTLDGKPHPFFTEHKSGVLRVNFGNDDYLPRGVHTYLFTYTFNGAIDFYKNYDELYWNVTGNDWNFTIDKARFTATVPPGATIQQNGISLYSGPRGSKSHKTHQLALLSFETTASLSPHEGFTVAIPFDKGFFVKPPLIKRLISALSWTTFSFILILILLFAYFTITWLQVGKDPSYLPITQYEPPEGISPTMMQYLHDRQATNKTLASAFISLCMKGYLEIQPNKSFFSSNKADIHYTGKTQEHLPPEEELLLNRLRENGIFSLGPSSAEKINKIYKEVKNYLKQEAEQYIITNAPYLKVAIVLITILGLLPPLVFKRPELIFINIHFSVFFTVFTFSQHRFLHKLIAAGIVTLFYSPFFFGICGFMTPIFIAELIFLIGMWGLSLYHTLIQNVTPRGKEVLSQIAGFEKYMKTAEINRFAASNPQDAERIFCDYLPFAFALGMDNQWMKKFEKILSKATLERCTSRVGGTRFISSGLASSISRSGGGGSHGGGSSGGGHGGGGGGGR